MFSINLKIDRRRINKTVCIVVYSIGVNIVADPCFYEASTVVAL